MAGFFSSVIGESLDLDVLAAGMSDTDKVCGLLGQGADTVFCGLAEVEDEGELLLELLVELKDEELSMIFS